MRKQTHYLIAVLVLVVVLSAVFLVYNNRLPAAPADAVGRAGNAAPRAGAPMGPPGESSQSHLAQLGVTGVPSPTEPRGLQITGFVPSSRPSPLEVIGVKEGDVIFSCNGQQRYIGRRLLAAIEGLQERGEPMNLEVIRAGQRLRLERAEKLPGA